MPEPVDEPNTDDHGPFASVSVPYREGVKTYDGPVFRSPEDLLIYKYSAESPGLFLHQVNFGTWLLPESHPLRGTFNRVIDALRIPGSRTAHRWLNDGPDIISVLRGSPIVELIESKRRLDKAASSANVIGEIALALDLFRLILPVIGASTELLPSVVCCETAELVVEHTLEARCSGTRVFRCGEVRASW
jgi:hypothetical protein